jgi:hypothetical protein
VFRAHDIRWFLYNGGNDSADTAHKLSQISRAFGYPLTCIGVPKTVDNDLAGHRLLPGLRLGRQVHRGVGARGQPRRRLDGRILDQGLRAGGDGPPRRLDRRRRGLAARRPPTIRRT